MSGRAEAWLDRDQQRKDAYRDILKESEQSVNVYRQVGNQSDAGFRSEVGAPVLAGTINVRIDGAKQRQAEDNQDSLDEDAEFTALTDAKNVLKADIWRHFDIGGQERFYKVVRVKAIEIGSAVWLKEIRKQRWPLAG